MKRFNLPFCQPGDLKEDPNGAFRLSSDFDALEAEAQALREEVAALKHSQQVLIGSRNAHRDERDSARKEVESLRARVVVVPDIRFSPYVASDRAGNTWAEMADDEAGEWINIERLARLNGNAVSEGLLRRIVEEQPAVQDIGEMFNWQYARDQAMSELRALLGEGKEHE